LGCEESGSAQCHRNCGAHGNAGEKEELDQSRGPQASGGGNEAAVGGETRGFFCETVRAPESSQSGGLALAAFKAAVWPGISAQLAGWH
jgi:hypothetical protein